MHRFDKGEVFVNIDPEQTAAPAQRLLCDRGFPVLYYCRCQVSRTYPEVSYSHLASANRSTAACV